LGTIVVIFLVLRHTVKHSVLATISLLALVAPCVGSCDTWYVTVGGSGDAPTIQAAIDSAAPGATVLVAPGTYNRANQGVPGFVRLIAVYKEIHLVGESGPEATILDADGGGGCIGVQGESGIIGPTIQGFTITNGSADEGEMGGGIRCWESGPTIRNCIITGNWAFMDGGGIICGYSQARIEHNLITHNTSAVGRGGGVFSGVSQDTITNNTFIANTADRGSGIGCLSSPLTLIANNIIASSPRGVALWCDGDSPSITCNDLWDNIDGDGNCALGTNNFSADPLFCDEGTGDFHLYEDSPCASGNSPSSCGLIGALPVGCWGAPIGSAAVALVAIAIGALGIRSVSRKRSEHRGTRH
jgi:hypothetical protein